MGRQHVAPFSRPVSLSPTLLISLPLSPRPPRLCERLNLRRLLLGATRREATGESGRNDFSGAKSFLILRSFPRLCEAGGNLRRTRHLSRAPAFISPKIVKTACFPGIPKQGTRTRATAYVAKACSTRERFSIGSARRMPCQCQSQSLRKVAWCRPEERSVASARRASAVLGMGLA